MDMTFGPWSNYQLVLVFDWWKVETHSQFIATWISVVLLTIAYHALRYASARLEMNFTLKTNGNANIAERSPSSLEMGPEESYLVPERNTSISAKYVPQEHEKRHKSWLRFQHASLAGVSYMLALFLMLVAMTYNSSLFVALVLGYAAGDYIFFSRTASLSSNSLHTRSNSGNWLAGSGTKYSSGDCH